MRRHGFSFKRKADDKTRSFSFFGFEMNAAIVLVYNHRTCNCQSLASSFAHFFGGKKWIEHSRLNVLRNPSTGVLYTNFDPVLAVSGLYPYLSFSNT